MVGGKGAVEGWVGEGWGGGGMGWGRGGRGRRESRGGMRVEEFQESSGFKAVSNGFIRFRMAVSYGSTTWQFRDGAFTRTLTAGLCLRGALRGEGES